ncbi:MAG: DUF2147 domain-containing protein [Pseudomonadota bacterium]
MFNRYSATGALAFSMMAASASVPLAQGASVSGTWKRPSTGAHIQAFPCAGGLGLRVVKSKTIRARGRRIMCGAKKTGPARFEGNLRNPIDGGTYYAIIELRGDTMKLQGCILGGLICNQETWTRVD